MNREIVGSSASIYPLQGDVVSQAGSSLVSVAGIRGIPISSANLSGGDALVYNINTNRWEPTLLASIQVNSVTVSDDSSVTVNVMKMIQVNGA